MRPDNKDIGVEGAFRQAGGDPGLTAMVRGDVLKGRFTLHSAPAENFWEQELDAESNDIAGAGRLMNNLRVRRRARKDDCVLNGICLMMMFNCPIGHHRELLPDHNFHTAASDTADGSEPGIEEPALHIH